MQSTDVRSALAAVWLAGGLVTAAAFTAAGLYLALTDGVATAVQTLGVTLLLIVAVLALVVGVTWGTHRLLTTRGVEP